MKPTDFHVGQTVYVEPYRARGEPEPEPALVTKIGRQWVTVGSGWREERFNPGMMLVDAGGGHTRSVWLSLDAWREHKRCTDTWRRFQERVRNQYVPPRGIATSTVERWISEFDAAKAGLAPPDQSACEASDAALRQPDRLEAIPNPTTTKAEEGGR